MERQGLEQRRPERRPSSEKLKLLNTKSEPERQMAGCCFAECQAPIQAFLRPAIWLPGVKRLHLYKQEWQISASVDECMNAFQSAAESLSEEEHLQIRKVDREAHFIRLFAFTAGCNWLDVVEVQFRPGSDSSTTTASARSFSTGVFPACIPLSFLWNVLFFWVPFTGNGYNTRRLKLLKDTMTLSVEVTSEQDCCGVA